MYKLTGAKLLFLINIQSAKRFRAGYIEARDSRGQGDPKKHDKKLSTYRDTHKQVCKLPE